MTTQLTHKGLVWIARKTETDGDKFTGSTPEVAIRKLWAEYPELNESEISYIRPKTTINRASVITDFDHCPTCGKPVVFVKAMKPNGWMGVIALHSDEDLPEEAIWNIPVLKEYKKEILRKLHAAIAKAPVQIKVEETESSTKLQENPIAKPKVIISPSYEAEILPDRKVVEVGGLNHNRFAMIGKVVSTLKDSIPEGQLKAIRSDLMTHGKDLNTLAAVASRYAIIHENGLPFIMESEL